MSNPPILTAALVYAARGWRVLPVYWAEGGLCGCGKPNCHSPGKHPITANGVKDASFDTAVLHEWWAKWPRANIALACGKASAVWVLDVDGQAGEMSLAEMVLKYGDEFLDTVEQVTGKGRHFFYRYAEGLSNKVRFVEGLDVRTDGGYVVIAPSVHASGRTYHWSGERRPDAMSPIDAPEWLLDAIRTVCAKPAPALASGEKVGKGKRNDYLFSLACAMQRRGVEQESILAAISTESNLRCDPPLSLDELTMIVRSAKRYEPEPGLLRHRLPPRVDPTGGAGIEQQADPKGLSPKEIEGNGHGPAKTLDGGGMDDEGVYRCTRTKDQRPVIHITPDLDLVADAATECLVQAKVEVYTRARLLVRVLRARRSVVQGVSRVQDAPVILEVSHGKLLDYLIQTARWEKCLKNKDGSFDWIHATPAAGAVEILQGRNEWPFEEIRGISESPFIRPDGSVCDTPGYDLATGILYEPNAPYDEIPEAPTKEDAVKAMGLLWEPLKEFPWAGQYDLPASLAALLTLVARPAIDGPVPAFTISAPAAGSGKTLLANLVCTMVHGHRPAMMTWIKEDEEFKKTLVSIGIAGDPAILVDNVDSVIESDFFAAILTGAEWEARLLGKNDTVPVPLQMVWFLTGNNLATKGDLFRRQIPIYLDPHDEHPEERKILHPFILREVLEQRHSLVPAAITILRAHFLAGRPRTVPAELFGSFESWDKVVRAAVHWAYGVDPCGNRPKAKDEGDPELGDLSTLLSAWNHTVVDGTPRTCAQLLRMCESNDASDLRDAISVLNTKGGDGKLPNTRTLGWFLRKHHGKILRGLRLTHRGEDRNGTTLWVVEKS